MEKEFNNLDKQVALMNQELIEKFLYPPKYPCYITQYFGENKACYKMVNGKSVVISKEQNAVCPAGYSSVYSQMKGHNGIDIMAKHNSPLFSSTDGVVVEVCTEEARGLGVGIVTSQKYYCKETGKLEYFKIRNWHLCAISVKMGQSVKVGDLIGYADNTGYSSGDHDHFEIKPVTFTKDFSNVRDVDLTNVLQDNGYFGAVDPLLYIKDLSFNTCKLGDSNNFVLDLQLILKYSGYFPVTKTCTGYYGEITRKAVFAFQNNMSNLSWYEKYIMKGSSFGPKTIEALSALLFIKSKIV